MSDNDVVRAWKDRRYRSRLSNTERRGIPASPAGTVELADERLAGLTGGDDLWPIFSHEVCTGSLCEIGSLDVCPK